VSELCQIPPQTPLKQGRVTRTLRYTSLLGEVVDKNCVDAFWCELLGATGTDFQACSIDHSDTSPFRINGLPVALNDYLRNCVRPPNVPRSLTAFFQSGTGAIFSPQPRNRAASPRHERRSGRSTARDRSTSCGSRNRSTKVRRTGNGSEPHARDIALRRRTEQAAVLAAELRSTFIPNTPCGATRVEVLIQHQLPCFL
jgi:hypothetical protein